MKRKGNSIKRRMQNRLILCCSNRRGCVQTFDTPSCFIHLNPIAYRINTEPNMPISNNPGYSILLILYYLQCSTEAIANS